MYYGCWNQFILLDKSPRVDSPSCAYFFAQDLATFSFLILHYISLKMAKDYSCLMNFSDKSF